AQWNRQPPRLMMVNHTRMLQSVLPEDQHAFERVIVDIRTDIGEWLWLNVLTRVDVLEAVESLANYFLLRNGKFSLALIREIERLKISRLTAHAGPSFMLRGQDLNLALLRASFGTSAQQDPHLTRLRFAMPTGPVRPLLPSLAAGSPSASASAQQLDTPFATVILGTQLQLTYTAPWPLDLVLRPAELTAYGALFACLSALRHTHTRVYQCWSALSNAQRARRRWTRLGEGGGTHADLAARGRLLCCAWGIVRDMGWFLDCVLGYVMTDVIDVEFARFS
ncbi:hypothetical protein FISHEDRAFT_11641, partial [Fistulina hepatica ATCC 64428]